MEVNLRWWLVWLYGVGVMKRLRGRLGSGGVEPSRGRLRFGSPYFEAYIWNHSDYECTRRGVVSKRNVLVNLPRLGAGWMFGRCVRGIGWRDGGLQWDAGCRI